MNNGKEYCEFCGESFRSISERNKHISHCSIEKNSMENIDIYFNLKKLEMKKTETQSFEKDENVFDILKQDDSFILNSATIVEIKPTKSIYGEYNLYKIDTKFKNFYLTRNQIEQLNEALKETKTFLPKEVVYIGKEEGKENPFETKHLFEIGENKNDD